MTDKNSTHQNSTEISDLKDDIAAIAQHLQRVQRVLFITGAGISADSGLPTYRGVSGLYNNGMTEEGLSIEDCLSIEVLQRAPAITWKYLWQIAENCRDARPNAAHLALAELEQKLPSVMVLTQNIDGLHIKAGSRNLVEIHGNFRRLQCTSCHWQQNVADISEHHDLPRCPRCGAVVRVPVVLFGESLPEDELLRFAHAWDQGFDLLFVIGTTCAFPYIAQPVLMAAKRNIPTVEINPDVTPISHAVRYRLPMGASDALSAIMDAYRTQPNR